MKFKKDLFKYHCVKVLDRVSLLARINFIMPKKLYGSDFMIPVIKRIGMHNLIESELWLNKLISFLQTKKEGAFVDVGINIGQTLLKVKANNLTTSYVGFEPNPVCNFYVHKLVEANNFDNVSLFPIGLANVNTLLRLHANNEYASGANLISKFRKRDDIEFIYHVPVFQGDSVLRDSKENISVIKIDV